MLYFKGSSEFFLYKKDTFYTSSHLYFYMQDLIDRLQNLTLKTRINTIVHLPLLWLFQPMLKILTLVKLGRSLLVFHYARTKATRY